MAAKASKKEVVEKFDPDSGPMTLEEHVNSHSYPMHVRTCGACKFWKNKEKWSKTLSAKNPVTGKAETWIGCAGGRYAVCLLCSAFKGPRSGSNLGQGVGSFLRRQNLLRHADCKEHQAAEAAWKERVRAEASHQGSPVSVFPITAATTASAAAATTAAAPAPVVARTADQRPGGRAVVATRAMLETSSSFRSFDVWRDALIGGERQLLESRQQCRRLVTTMAQYEKIVTQRILNHGAVFRLAADGLDRTYQVEIGTVLWSIPKALAFLPTYGLNAGWLEQLGPNGPWIVERVIGMREFPRAMDCDGKASMLEDCVRRACLQGGGELDVDLHKHVRGEMRAWCSDGADLTVPLAATETFPKLAFHAWDEAHSAQKLLANSMKGDSEILITDELLVTGKTPQSLAKFLTLSTVFRNTVGEQQQVEDQIAFVKNFGWAPQRFNSRARPLARESRRWKVIFDALGVESQGTNPDRRILARSLLEGLGGENSSRLLLGGLLADLCAEHYSWVATGDKSNPDAASVQSRAQAFLHRLDTLFVRGNILAMPDTYTGATLQFLRETHRFPCGNGAQIVSIGDWTTDGPGRAALKGALRRVQRIVANVQENMKLYRPEHSWLHAFTAFRLPSPLSATDADATERATEAEDCLRRICQEADLPEQQAIPQLRMMLKRAEVHRRDGATTRQAWGRAAADWPEHKSGRRLVELFLVWKTSTGNVERRFRRFSELHCPERAQMLDVSVEECTLVDQAPPSKLLRTWLDQQGDETSAASRWYRHVLKLHEHLQGKTAGSLRRAERRDKGSAREPPPRPGRRTEVDFGRKRAAAVDAMVAASPSKRARLLRERAPDLAAVAQEVAQASREDPVGPAATVVAAVAKREVKIRQRNLGGARAAAEARSSREKKVMRSAKPAAGRDAYLLPPPRPAGLMLVRTSDAEARRKAQLLRFRPFHDPVEFLTNLPNQAKGKGHAVLAPTADNTDYAIAAQIVAAFTGAFFTTPTDFAKQDSPKGIQYSEKLRGSTKSYHVAVTDALKEDLPTLPHVLRALALAPSGCVVYYKSPKKLWKFYKNHAKATPRLVQRACVLCRAGEEAGVDKKVKQLYNSPRNWVLRFDASVQALCPGTKAATA